MTNVQKKTTTNNILSVTGLMMPIIGAVNRTVHNPTTAMVSVIGAPAQVLGNVLALPNDYVKPISINDVVSYKGAHYILKDIEDAVGDVINGDVFGIDGKSYKVKYATNAKGKTMVNPSLKSTTGLIPEGFYAGYAYLPVSIVETPKGEKYQISKKFGEDDRIFLFDTPRQALAKGASLGMVVFLPNEDLQLDVNVPQANLMGTAMEKCLQMETECFGEGGFVVETLDGQSTIFRIVSMDRDKNQMTLVDFDNREKVVAIDDEVLVDEKTNKTERVYRLLEPSGNSPFVSSVMGERKFNPTTFVADFCKKMLQ